MNPFTGTSSVVALASLGEQRGTPSRRQAGIFTALPPAMPSQLAMSGLGEANLVPRLRKIVAAWLRHSCHMAEDRVEDVLVVASELITNSVLHGEGHSVSYVCWSPQPGLIRFEIGNSNETEAPQPHDPPLMAESGRGLHLVSLFVKELGGDWGYINRGATAWCCLPIQDDRPASGRREL